MVTVRLRSLFSSSALAAAGVGALIFALSAGATILSPGNVGWLFNGGVDPSIHFVGWHMYRFSPWDLPIGATANLGYPVGTSVALTDSIPLAAMLLKPFSALLPDVFQYFGLWLLASFVLQGAVGAALVGTLTTSRWIAFLGGSMFALSPLLLHRMGHAALTAHWTLLAALWLGRERQWVSARHNVLPWVILGGVSAGIHPYIAVMVGALALGTFASHITTLRATVSRGLMPLLAVGGTMVAVWWMSGYFIVPDSSELQSSGFGMLSMNLLAPMVPLDGTLLKPFIPFGFARYDQHEGTSYLGLGGLFLVLSGLILLLLRPSRLTRQAAFMVAACVGLTLFALSPVVTMGDRVLFEYPAEWWGPLATFRASGRMFWPVYYAIVLAAIATVIRVLSPRMTALILVVALGLQAVDLWNLYRVKRAGFYATFHNPLVGDEWSEAFRGYRHVVLNPSNMCVPMEQSLDYRFFALHAGPAGATLNGGFAARYDAAAVARYCEAYRADVSAVRLQRDSVYVLSEGAAVPYLAPGGGAQCRPLDGYVICVIAAP